MILNHDVRGKIAKELGVEFKKNKLLAFEMNDFFLNQSENITYNLVMDKTVHTSFSSFLIMTQNLGSWSGFLSKIAPWTMNDILNDYTLVFYNKHFKGTEEPMLDGESKKYPDIINFEVK